MPAATSAEPHEEQVAAGPDDTGAEVSAAKQRTITDFYSPCSSASNGSGETRRALTPPFITPHPSVSFSEVPVVFQVQSDCVAEDYLDPTHPLFERELSEPSSEPSTMGTNFSPAQLDVSTPSSTLPNAAIREGMCSRIRSMLKILLTYNRDKYIKKRSRRYSTPKIFATWHDRMISSSSNHETLPESAAQNSEWSFLDPPVMVQENAPFDSFSSPPGFAAIDRSGASSEADAETDSAEVDVEQYWIEKDEERLTVIFGMEKTMAGMKEEQANTAKAFQMAAKANQKLQAELKKKKSTLRQMEDVINDLLHNLDAADMDTERLEKELANSRIDCKYQLDRAEESMTSVQGGPSQGTIAELIQAKAEAESRITAQKMEWESEKDSLESQLKERCKSVAHLTETLSRVADLDRWQEVRRELEELAKRAGQLPEDLEVALLECERCKNRHNNISQEHAQLRSEKASLQEQFLSEKATLQETLQELKDFDLRRIRELKQKWKDKKVSERALKGCLKRAFERMVRCSLCLETEGYSPFDSKHREICEKVSELTGEDYQEPLLNYYAEHDVESEFKFGDDGVADDEEVVFDNQGAQAGSEELDVHGNDQESTLELSSAPTPGTTENDSVTSSTTQEQEGQESPVIQEARNEREVIHTNDSQITAADQAFPAVPDPLDGPRDQRGNTPSNGRQGFSIFSSAGSTNPTLNEGEGRSQDFWSNTSFAAVENNPFASNAASAADLEANTNKVPPVFNLFAISQSAEVETPASEHSEAEQGTEAIESPREAAPSTTNAAFLPPQLQEFNFGGNISPAAFTNSSPYPSTPAPRPSSNGIFSFGEQHAASVDVQLEEEAAEEREISEEDMSNTEAPTEKAEEEEEPPFTQKTPDVNPSEQNVTQNENLPDEITAPVPPTPQIPSPSPSPTLLCAPPSPPPPSRSQQKRAKKAQEKAIKKAEMEARNAKARERRRVQEVMMMRC